MPPLDLKDYVILKIRSEANPNFLDNVAEAKNPQVNVKSDIRQDKDDANMFMSKLSIEFGSQDEDCSYFGEIVLMGIFETKDDLTNEDKINHIGITGNSMLYSSAREMILQITSRGPNPSVILPTVKFLKDEKSEVNH